ncbi:MAG: mechanosensitive ion channel family protein [Dehalococcoidia bacterium]
MSKVLFQGVTGGDLVYFGIILGIGVLVAIITRIIAGRTKRKLRSKSRVNLVAQLVDDLEEAIFLWVLLVTVYFGLLALPPLSDHLDVMRQVFTVASIVLVVYGSIRVQGDALKWYIRRVGRRTAQAKVLNSLVPMARRIVSIVIVAMGILVILDQLGISIAPLVAGLGIGGFAVALALQGTLTNFFAGINVLTDGSIRIGDFVELDGGMRGYVDQIGWRTTRIRMLANNMVIIPNSKLAESVATNYNYPEDQMSVYVEVGVSYDSDLDHVERVTVEVAKKVMEETEGSVEGYEPSIWYTEFADSNINFWAVLRAKGYLDSWLIKHNFIKALFRRYNEEGIEISFPNRNIFMRNGAVSPQPVQTAEGAAYDTTGV